MANSRPKTLGVTPPISIQPPTEREVAATAALIEILRSRDLFEDEEESVRREMVLGQLDRLVKEFVYAVSIERGLPENIARDAGGKIFTFGSYRLGAHGRGADIDTLCVVPRHVHREDFFEKMYEMLKGRAEVTELAAVPDAFVPVIKMEFSGIPIDLVFARLAQSSVPDDLDLADDNLLKNLDERCVRSLNGSRVTDEILRLVPNVSTFRLALMAVKLWAKQRAVYGNVLGYLGGVAWAMLVARICQLYPNADAAGILVRFFSIMFKWRWPHPVLLCPIKDGPLQVRVWNPKIYAADRSHRMPIITPAYPSMCATHNVTESTLSVMRDEFGRGSDIMRDMMASAEESTLVKHWNRLFARHDFFHRYRYYLQVVASSDDAEVQLKWSGMVESRLRQLVMKLEMVEGLAMAVPFIDATEKQVICRNDEEANVVASGSMIENPATEETDGARVIYTSTFYIGLELKPKQPGAANGRRLDISWPTNEFLKMVRAWDGYKEDHTAVTVKHIKNAQLPDDVFIQGEERGYKGKQGAVAQGEKVKLEEPIADDVNMGPKRLRSETPVDEKEEVSATKHVRTLEANSTQENASDAGSVSSETAAKAINSMCVVEGCFIWLLMPLDIRMGTYLQWIMQALFHGDALT